MYIVHIYILKVNSLKFKFWFKQTRFIYPKCIFEKVPPPPIWTKSKRTAAFFVSQSLRQHDHCINV